MCEIEAHKLRCNFLVLFLFEYWEYFDHQAAVAENNNSKNEKVEGNVDGAKAAAIPKNLQKRVPLKLKPKAENVIAISSDTEKEEDIKKKEIKPSKSKKKIQSLTSVLTARSKVACGLTNKPKEDIVDIDSTDVNNELAVVEYVEDMYKFYKLAKLENLVYFYAKLGIMNYNTSIVYCPSMLAASAVYAARCTLSPTPTWSETSRLHTCFSEPQLIDCAELLVGFHSAAPEGKLRVIYKKYSKSEMGSVAFLSPAKSLL
ncbi:Cyclin, C-terminal domain [Dillenia turbinata]|uniref:Cyclin, C-terminal domain n=1 Tax=Dillenia turbinata TaxID=194707 RepID=A0AAN8W5L1_9MAGN